MQLLREVVLHDDESTTCNLRVSDSALFCEDDGRVPSWVGLEYMAQCVAVDGALRGRGAAPLSGPVLLLGARMLTFEAGHFEPDQVLEVEARRIAGDHRRAAFGCSVRDARDGRTLVEGRLSVAARGSVGGPRVAEARGGA
jgi:predicted hotdog family 3-hydroxylacyl-ACP dehydratase